MGLSISLALADQPLYKDSTKPIDARVNDLITRMTLEEKVAQLQAVWLKRQELETDAGVFTPAKAKDILGSGIGQIARPAENKAPVSPNNRPSRLSMPRSDG